MFCFSLLIGPLTTENRMQLSVVYLLIANLLVFNSNCAQIGHTSSESHGTLISNEEFYKSRDFHELLKEFNIKVDYRSLPDINDIMILLGTTNIRDTVQEIREIASTKDGMDMIRSYLGRDNDEDKREESEYVTTSLPKEPDSWWSKAIKWLGLEQSPKVNSLQTDLNILSKAVPPPTPFGNRFVYVKKFLKPETRPAVTIHPPFKIFESQYGNQPRIVNGYETLPTIRLTESQYNQMVRANRRSDAPQQRPMLYVATSRPFTTEAPQVRETESRSMPVRVSYDFDATGSIYKANPHDVNKISRRLSESIE